MITGCYLYCIIKSKKDEDFGNIGIGGRNVRTINYKDICAVVSDSVEAGSLEVLKEGMTHQKVVEAVSKKYTVVPMGFGQVPGHAAEVKGFLVGRYGELNKLFAKIEHKVELGLKVSWKMDVMIKELVASSDRIRILQKQISSLPAEKSYKLKMELGEQVAKELNAHGETLTKEILNSLNPLAADVRTNPPLNNEMILNAAFLVSKDKEAQFDESVNEIEKKYPQLTIKYIVSPPYNFTSLGEKHAGNR